MDDAFDRRAYESHRGAAYLASTRGSDDAYNYRGSSSGREQNLQRSGYGVVGDSRACRSSGSGVSSEGARSSQSHRFLAKNSHNYRDRYNARQTRSSSSPSSSSSSSSSSLASEEGDYRNRRTHSHHRTGHHSHRSVTTNSAPRQVRWVLEEDDGAADFPHSYPRYSRPRSSATQVYPREVEQGYGASPITNAPPPYSQWPARPPSAHVNGTGGLQRVFTPPVSPQGAISNLQPSPLLVEVVRSVAYYRNVPCPAQIYPEVILAFDEYLARGVTLKKFIANGPPHDRFFAIRFLDLQHRRPSGAGGSVGGRAVPEAVFCWYRTQKSTNMRRYFPLADLFAVRKGGTGHPYIEKRKSKAMSKSRGGHALASPRDGNEIAPYAHNGNTEDNYMLIRNGKRGLFQKYINDAYVLQLGFRSLLTNTEEIVAVQAPNPTVLLALHVVSDYLSRIGSDL